MRRIVALDQSLSSCGFALWDEGDFSLKHSGAWKLADGIRNRSAGFVELFRNLAAFHDEKPIDLLVHEMPMMMPKDKREKLVALYGLVAVIETFCKSKGIPWAAIEIRDWRKTYFSSEEREGKPDWKRMAILRSRQLGFDPICDDEAEAIGILDHQIHKMNIKPPWRKEHPFLDSLA